MSIEQLITEHLDIWTAADTEKKSGRGRSSGSSGNVYGIKKLRELILELAVRGKLVPQDANDEPASELLKRIATEKAKLIAEGKIKKTKPLADITDDEKPFELPIGWSLERLCSLSHMITKGTTPTSLGFSYQNEGIRFVKVENVSFGRININSIDQYISEETDKALARSRLMTGDVLFSIAGTIGRTCIVYSKDIPANTNQAFAIIRGTTTAFDQMFLLRQLDSFVSNKTKEKARGGAMNNVSLSDLSELILIIPPLAEQHRIVAKVDELMALCDQLENQHNNAAEAHEKLVTHLLGTLTQSQNAEDFNTNWHRISEHFDTLFTTEASIDALKQTLLQLAVMGKLVPQDPNDEPASELLKRIQAEKAKLIAEGKIKKDKPLAEISEEEKPFDLPAGWEWARLIDIIKISSGDGLTSDQMDKTGEIPVYGGNGITGYHSIANVNNPTLVIGRVGYYCGSIHVTPESAWVTDNAFITKFSKENISMEFLYWLLKITNLKENESATAQPVISGKKIYPIVIALPPLLEQRGIVAKIAELMAICDQLKERITSSNQLQQKLADVMVEQAI